MQKSKEVINKKKINIKKSELCAEFYVSNNLFIFQTRYYQQLKKIVFKKNDNTTSIADVT